MKMIGVVAQKGGVGKTTTVVNLAFALAYRKRKVLIVDTDPQGQCITFLGGEKAEGASEVLTHQASIRDVAISVRDGIDVVAGDMKIPYAIQDIVQTRAKGMNSTNVFNRVRADARHEGYDFMIVDTAPSAGVFQWETLEAADSLIVPSNVSVSSVEGIASLIATMLSMRVDRGKIRAIVPSFYRKRVKESMRILDSLRTHFPHLVTPPVPYTVRMDESQAQGKSIFETDPKHPCADAYAKLMWKVLSW